MLRTTGFFVALVVSAAAFAQSYTGTFTSRNAQGGIVTLAIKQDAQGKVAGTLAGNGANFKVEGTVNAEGLYGTVISDGGTLLIAAQLEGPAQLKVVLAEPLPNGQPNMAAARRLVFARQGGAPAAAAAGAPGPGSGQAQVQAGQDAQLTAFLTRNAWCGFTFNKTTGASRSERVVFNPNGIVSSGSNAESYSSGPAGSVAGQSRGGNQGRWKVQNAKLLLSQDGYNWEPQNLQITQNSSGSPIIKNAGKEYMVCR